MCLIAPEAGSILCQFNQVANNRRAGAVKEISVLCRLVFIWECILYSNLTWMMIMMMRSKIHWMFLLGATLVAAMLMGLAACSDSQAARSSPGGDGTSLADSYVLVTQLRPVSREQYVAYQRSVYELCALILENNQRVAKPFPAMSNDFAGTRTTYASDGKRTVVRERVDTLDFVAGQTESTCEMRWSTRTNVTLTSDGKEQTPRAGENGAGHNGDSAQMSTAPGDAAPYAIAQILEPLSLSVGKPVDPALFALDIRQ
jgi:hypothetical protein